MTLEQQVHYDWFENRRRDALPLPKGVRYLTVDDFWQIGDEYNGGSGWWKVGSQLTSVRAGQRVDKQFPCYTPRGLIMREKT